MTDPETLPNSQIYEGGKKGIEVKEEVAGKCSASSK